MHQHPNARLTPLGRRRLVERVEGGERVASVAREMGVSRQTAHKWLSRARADEPLSDRRSRPRRMPRRIDPEREALVVARRLEPGRDAATLALETGVPTRTCARIVARARCPHLSEYDPVTGALLPKGPATHVRHGRDAPGDPPHVDVKRLPTIREGGGFRARGPRKAEHCGSGRGHVCVHVAVDGRSRVCYAEVHSDEKKGTCMSFMWRARAYFRGLGVEVRRIMTDDGPAYRSKLLNRWLKVSGIKHACTRPYSPWQNGKVERTSQTLARDRSHARAWAGDAERTDALAKYLERYNSTRPHSACGGLPPMSRICQQRVGI